RVLANDFIDKWHGREAELAEKIDIIMPQYQKAWEEGDIDMANVFVGEATGLIADIQPAAEIIASMVEQAEKIIRKQQGYIQ
ncbi:MAG: nitronate monooxygenase, partial [Candidatus Puniceispirillaceae bacterium]